ILYWLVPKMWRTNLYSKKLADFHFWIGTLGIIFYAIPMYWAGFTQSFMWKEFTEEGFLKYPNFLETVTALKNLYFLRGIGGTLYFTGVLVMVYNLMKTAKAGIFLANEAAEAPALIKFHEGENEYWHKWIEKRPVQMLVVSFVLVAIGGIVEMVPTFLIKSNIPTISSVKPYTPLELEGRDIYIREGCYVCHSQLVRPFRSETERYGDYSKAGEFVYDHPFQWGSKRTGPDLAREGTDKLRKPNAWHYTHMLDPRLTSPNSIMPPYPWLIENTLDISKTPDKIKAMRKLGVPYPDGYEHQAIEDLKKQAQEIADDLNKNNIKASPDKEIIALIAYLQRLGVDVSMDKKQASK
ncbi:MAG: cytochrome-c oxidase, cbb3-type subunit II, partial [Bacteroidetes bacterium]